MSLPQLCIRRPVMTTLLMMSFIVFGVFGLHAVFWLPRGFKARRQGKGHA